MKLLLKHCDILAGDGEGYRYLADAYLSIDGSVIDYIGTEPPKAAYDREKDMTGKMLAPGLINCHGHTAMTLLRGVGSDLPLQEWLFEKMMPIEDQFTKEDIRIGNRLALLEMISTGTTSAGRGSCETVQETIFRQYGFCVGCTAPCGLGTWCRYPHNRYYFAVSRVCCYDC